jgi:hypothetical protein
MCMTLARGSRTRIKRVGTWFASSFASVYLYSVVWLTYPKPHGKIFHLISVALFPPVTCYSWKLMNTPAIPRLKLYVPHPWLPSSRHLIVFLSTHGIPAKIKFDNSPQFQTHLFAQFAQYMGFRHRKITLEWPKANSECDHLMRTLQKTHCAAHLEDNNWK